MGHKTQVEKMTLFRPYHEERVTEDTEDTEDTAFCYLRWAPERSGHPQADLEHTTAIARPLPTGCGMALSWG